MKNKESVTKRYRTYATVVYPESAPENWMDILAESKIPCVISPLHDQDLNPGGEKKKPHHHVVLCYDSPKNEVDALMLFAQIGGVGCERVQSKRGYVRYLCHLDNPEKHQYSVDDVIAYGGVDFFDIIDLPTDRYKAIDEMMDFADMHENYLYRDLVRYARAYRRDWFRVLCDSGTFVIKEYLKSCSYAASLEVSNEN